MLILIAQKKRLGALNATQKTIGLSHVPLLRQPRKTSKNGEYPSKISVFWTFWCFSVTCDFLRCVQCPNMLLHQSLNNLVFSSNEMNVNERQCEFLLSLEMILILIPSQSHSSGVNIPTRSMRLSRRQSGQILTIFTRKNGIICQSLSNLSSQIVQNCLNK